MIAEFAMFVASSLLFRKLTVKNLSNSNAFLSSASTTMSLADFRKEYSRTALVESDLPGDPLILFRQWLQDAVVADTIEPNAMCLSTCKVRILPFADHVCR